MTEKTNIYIGGIDIGTTGCKIAVFDNFGKLCGTYYTEYDATHRGGKHEIEFDSIKTGLLSILKSATAEFHLSAVGVTSFGESFAMLDENDIVLAPSMLYTDPRGKEQCEKLCTALGKDKLTFLTGVAPNEMYSIAKIMWQKENNPDIFARCSKILLAEDFGIYMLTGERKIDHSLAARTGAFDISGKCWCREIFEAAGIDMQLMSQPVEAGSLAGNISENIKRLLNIDYDIKVINGCHDQVAAMIGAGVFEKGMAMDGTGTVECIPVILDEIPREIALYEKGYSVVPFVDGRYACYALSFTGGAVLKWFRDNFSENEKEIAAKIGKNVYSYLDSMIPERPTEILVLPHFAGAATPYMDTESKAAIIGITLETTKFDIYRALMEGTSYEILLNFNELKKFTGEVTEIRATGGGASSDAWLKIKSDILGTKILASSGSEIGAAGTAALAGVNIGIFNELKSASALLSDFSKEVIPDEKNKKAYAEMYKKYRDLYISVKNLGKGE